MSGPVLITDDDEDVREAVQMVLEQEGIPTVTAADGEQAITRARLNPQPSLVLLDLMMPGLSGLDTARALRSDERTAHIPVVLFTGDVQGHATAEELHADGCIGKPVDVIDLMNTVRRFVT